jgi:hypothetical protein
VKAWIQQGYQQSYHDGGTSNTGSLHQEVLDLVLDPNVRLSAFQSLPNGI